VPEYVRKRNAGMEVLVNEESRSRMRMRGAECGVNAEIVPLSPQINAERNCVALCGGIAKNRQCERRAFVRISYTLCACLHTVELLEKNFHRTLAQRRLYLVCAMWVHSSCN
jgi:hypothetical protein